MSTQPADHGENSTHLELPLEELLRHVRPLGSLDELVIDGLTEEEGQAFLAALEG